MLQLPRTADEVDLMYADNFPAYDATTRILSGHLDGSKIINAVPTELTDPSIIKTQLLLLKAFHVIKEETLLEISQRKSVVQPHHFMGLLSIDNLVKHYCGDDPEMDYDITQRIIRFCTLYDTKFHRNQYSDKRDKSSGYVRWFHHDEIIYGLLHLWALWYVPYLKHSERSLPNNLHLHIQNIIKQPSDASEKLIINVLAQYL